MSLLFNMALTYLHTQDTNLLIFFYWFVIKFNQVNYLYDLTEPNESSSNFLIILN